MPSPSPSKILLVALWLSLSACALSTSKGKTMTSHAEHWARGMENQRKADLGNGFYLNPIISGDHADPSVVKVGADYYMTHSSFDATPGLMIWHSKDLVNWQPLGPALTTQIDSVWAPEPTHYQGKFYLYYATNKIVDEKGTKQKYLYVQTADRIEGPWSEPVDTGLENPHSDPGHIVGEDGKRYIFMSGGMRVQLSDDGLKAVGKIEKVYDGWQYPQEWDVESFSQEGPKMLRHGDYFYMVLAEGGTAGPATGHMVIVARAKSINGPWENALNNPIVRTQSPNEKWWSRGHATPVEGPDGQWYMMYHGYENGFMTLGRQTLMEPISWTTDGWIKSAGFDVGQPIPMPKGGQALPHGMAFSDSFTPERFGTRWNFYKAGKNESERVRLENGALILKAKGQSPKDSSPLNMIPGDLAYEVEVEMEIGPKAQAGLLLFYNKGLYAGLGIHEKGAVMHRYGLERNGAKPAHLTGNRVFIRLKNDRHVVTIHTSADGQKWVKYPTQMEVSGYHHNVAYDFLSLRPAIYAAGEGEVRFSHFKYRALP